MNNTINTVLELLKKYLYYNNKYKIRLIGMLICIFGMSLFIL